METLIVIHNSDCKGWPSEVPRKRLGAHVPSRNTVNFALEAAHSGLGQNARTTGGAGILPAANLRKVRLGRHKLTVLHALACGFRRPRRKLAASAVHGRTRMSSARAPKTTRGGACAPQLTVRWRGLGGFKAGGSAELRPQDGLIDE